MAATLDIKFFLEAGGGGPTQGYSMLIRPVITVTTTGVTHCNNSKLTVTYSGSHFNDSDNSTVTVGQNTIAQIYSRQKLSASYKNDMSGTVTVAVKLATSSGTIAASRSVSYTSASVGNFDAYPSADWKFTDTKAGEPLDPYLGTDVVLISLDDKGYGYKFRFNYWFINHADFQSSDPTRTPGTVCSIPIEPYAQKHFANNKTSAPFAFYYDFVNVDGSTALTGVSYLGRNAYLPESVRPTITSVTPSDKEGHRDFFGVYIGTKSILQASVDASGIYGSTITKVAYQIDNLSVSTTDPDSTTLIGRLDQSGSRILKTTVTDSRGRTAVRNTTITVVPYVLPSVTATANRWDPSSSDYDDAGESVRVEYTANIPSYNGHNNQAYIYIDHKESGAENYDTIVAGHFWGPSFSGNYTFSSQSINKRYEYRVRVLLDRFTTGASTEATTSVGLGTPILEFHNSGKGVGIGTFAPETGLNIGMQADFRGTDDDGFSRIRIANPEGTETIALAKLTGSVLELLAPSSPVTDYDRALVNSHIFMRNNLGIGGLTTSGEQTPILCMNNSNQVELTWTTGGLKGRVMKELWSGTWSSGSITVPELPYYNVFLILTASNPVSPVPILAARYNLSSTHDRILGTSGQFEISNNYMHLTQFQAQVTLSDPTVLNPVISTGIARDQIPSNASFWNVKLEVAKIYGIL